MKTKEPVKRIDIRFPYPAVCESPNIPVYLPIPMYGIPRTPDFSQDLKFENVSTLHLL